LRRYVPLVAALVVVSALVLRGAIERAAFAGIVRSATGARVSFTRLTFSHLHTFTATNLKLRSASGHSTLEAKSAVVSFDGERRRFEVTLRQPHAVVSRDDFRQIGDDLAGLGAKGVRLRVAGGSIDVGPARIKSIDGWLDAFRSHLTYSVRAEIVDATGTYPVRGRAQANGGILVHRWDAAALPLGTLLSLAAPDPLAIHSASGRLSDVRLTARVAGGGPPELRASARLADGEVRLGEPAHTLSKLDGKIVLIDDGGGSRSLSGTLDGVPITMSGLLERYDVARFEKLLLQIAAEPNLAEVHIEATAPGIAFAKYRLQSPDGRLAIFVASVDTHNPTISLNAVLAGNHVTSGGERTSTMGQRTGAVLGIDGDYFDIGQSYAPQGILIISGKLLRSPAKRYAMTIHRGNHVTFDEYSFSASAKVGDRTIPIRDFNVYPPGKVGIVTPDFGSLSPHPGVVFVDLAPLPETKPGGMGAYEVTSVGPIASTRPARFGLAFGKWAGVAPPRVGETVDLHWSLTPGYDDIVAAEGGGPLMIRDGHWIEDPDAPAPGEHDVRWPVVGVGRLADDTLMFFEVDGRWPDVSIGMTRPEFGQLMLRYHVVDGFAMDSGGSADIVSRKPGDREVSLRSHPSDMSWERYVSDAVFVYTSAPNVDP
jgi:exopolysaccharide biosynthesis protein